LPTSAAYAMSGISVFADTNLIIYLLDGNEQVAQLLQDRTVCVSFVTELELLSKPDLSPLETTRIQTFLNSCVVLDFFPSLKESIIQLRKTYRLKLPDAIVAATALSVGLPLLSADKVFARIVELDFVLIEV
jgi:predicted nucleic acid-binding protein